ncbi:hypothetical protein [Slackia piriformis]|uniref:hypothetical protein n=1 Tax=Slackia piriformis TaxID=626934 RepID=UPI0032BFA294
MDSKCRASNVHDYAKSFSEFFLLGALEFVVGCESIARNKAQPFSSPELQSDDEQRNCSKPPRAIASIEIIGKKMESSMLALPKVRLR